MPKDFVTKPPRVRPSVGHLSPLAHVLVYVLLVAMLAVDYLLLAQALTLLLRNDSQYGSIGLQMYVITLGISLAVVSLPHVAAIVLRRVQARVMAKGWIPVAAALLLLWAGLLAAITVARITAGIDAAGAGGLTGLVGGSTSAAPAFSWSAPDTIMAFLMLGVLATSGTISFVIAWLTTRPLLVATEKAHAHVARLRTHRDRLLAEAVKAEEAAHHTAQLDAQDAVRYAGAYTTFHARLDVIRARVATRLAQRARDPESTSQIIRELRARRVVEAAEPTPAVPAFPHTAAVESAAGPTGMQPAAAQVAEASAVDGSPTTWGFER
ncbi:hypothetical protein ACPPVW_12470 [Leifsonia sp. McL0607]|uniref:hypothetical protein n=1 Tax=Leifsonia sp. McL0607 TaxID=3415672 RepID=UPI003CF07D85